LSGSRLRQIKFCVVGSIPTSTSILTKIKNYERNI